ncbi:MAG: DUF1080 domain-containing protein [Bryobacteraceae bacterium]|nr:DUF1080 domain-containing protein [Bryobacteraceae bacterium]
MTTPYRMLILTVVFAGMTAAPGFCQAAFPEPIGGDEAGFQPIFDGKSLNGWEGDARLWRAEGGTLIGEITPATLLKQNSFLIWRGGVTRDFELKLEYRMSAEGNSGINYRSDEVPGVPLALRGYQADIDSKDQWTGQNYEERGRTFLALRGQMTRIEAGKKPRVIASLGDNDRLKSFIKQGDWNECHLIVRGNTLIHILNGQTMSIVIDDDGANRKMEGLLGLQVHVGPPMKIEFRNIRFKKL